MALPIKSILWAPTNSAHYDHLHVEGDPRFTGTPPPSNPGMSDAVWTIYVALSERFGEPAYMRGGDWNHMGWYNRRYIGGTTTWSQHAWSNAIDIGPYYGVAQQQKFYDFLTGDDDELTPEQKKALDQLVAADLKPYNYDHLKAIHGAAAKVNADVENFFTRLFSWTRKKDFPSSSGGSADGLKRGDKVTLQ